MFWCALASARGAVTQSNTNAPITAAPASPPGETTGLFIDLKNTAVIEGNLASLPKDMNCTFNYPSWNVVMMMIMRETS